MNTSSELPPAQRPTAPVTVFSYRDIADSESAHAGETGAAEERQQAPGFTAQEVEDLLNRARAEVVTQTETRLRVEYEARSKAEAEKIHHAVEVFQVERRDYFSRVESEVVQLALSIAGKILHREAQVDPMLVAALVRVAIEKLHDGSTVSIRVPLPDTTKWQAVFSSPINGSTVEIVEDAQLHPGDCILETDLGSANFSIDAQLKEVEQGFFDLLAQRPVDR